LAQKGLNWPKLVQTGLNWPKLVKKAQTGHSSSLGFDIALPGPKGPESGNVSVACSHGSGRPGKKGGFKEGL